MKNLRRCWISPQLTCRISSWLEVGGGIYWVHICGINLLLYICLLNKNNIISFIHLFRHPKLMPQKNNGYRNAINSQKFSDERHGPFKPTDFYRTERRTRPNFRATAAISAYAGRKEGDCGSFSAVRYYQGEFAKRRDEILTDIAKNG